MRKRSRELQTARRELGRTLFMLDRIALHGLVDVGRTEQAVIAAARKVADLVLSDGDVRALGVEQRRILWLAEAQHDKLGELMTDDERAAWQHDRVARGNGQLDSDDHRQIVAFANTRPNYSAKMATLEAAGIDPLGDGAGPKPVAELPLARPVVPPPRCRDCDKVVRDQTERCAECEGYHAERVATRRETRAGRECPTCGASDCLWSLGLVCNRVRGPWRCVAQKGGPYEALHTKQSLVAWSDGEVVCSECGGEVEKVEPGICNSPPATGTDVPTPEPELLLPPMVEPEPQTEPEQVECHKCGQQVAVEQGMLAAHALAGSAAAPCPGAGETPYRTGEPVHSCNEGPELPDPLAIRCDKCGARHGYSCQTASGRDCKPHTARARDAKRRHSAAKAAAFQAKVNAAALSVPCPAHNCDADAGEPCRAAGLFIAGGIDHHGARHDAGLRSMSLRSKLKELVADHHLDAAIERMPTPLEDAGQIAAREVSRMQSLRPRVHTTHALNPSCSAESPVTWCGIHGGNIAHYGGVAPPDIAVGCPKCLAAIAAARPEAEPEPELPEGFDPRATARQLSEGMRTALWEIDRKGTGSKATSRTSSVRGLRRRGFLQGYELTATGRAIASQLGDGGKLAPLDPAALASKLAQLGAGPEPEPEPIDWRKLPEGFDPRATARQLSATMRRALLKIAAGSRMARLRVSLRALQGRGLAEGWDLTVTGRAVALQLDAGGDVAPLDVVRARLDAQIAKLDAVIAGHDEAMAASPYKSEPEPEVEPEPEPEQAPGLTLRCPVETCGAEPGQSCETPGGHRTAHTHPARLRAELDAGRDVEGDGTGPGQSHRCPVCFAPVGEACRSKHGVQATTHKRRAKLQDKAAPARRVVALVACSKTKADTSAGAVPARDLYTGSLFVLCRIECEKRIEQGTLAAWFVASALHGLVAPGDELESYDKQLRSSGDARDAWGEQLAAALLDSGEVAAGDVVELHAGKAYTPRTLVVALDAAGVGFEYIGKGLGYGQRRALYGRRAEQLGLGQ